MNPENHQLSNGSILIRPHRMEDARPSFEAILESLDELMPWMAWCHADIAFSEIEKWVASRPGTWLNDTDYDFAIIDLQQGTLVGTCGLVRHDPLNKRAELGYWIRTTQTRKGYATQAAKLALKFAFDVLQLNRIEIIIDTMNVNSQKVAEKLGAKKEGLLRQHLNVHDTFRDVYLYSILAEEYVSA